MELEKKLTMGKKNSIFFCKVPLNIKMWKDRKNSKGMYWYAKHQTKKLKNLPQLKTNSFMCAQTTWFH
jgi:hypothetical protein